MSLLFVNGCMREGSRTERLARMWLERRAYEGEVKELRLVEADIRPLDAERLKRYNESVKTATYTDAMFDVAYEFAAADEVLIAAPFWNYGLPAKLHDYLELVCSQGVTFDIDENGAYRGLVACKRLTFVTTAGGPEVAPQDDHAFGYVRTLAERFWFIERVERVALWGADAIDADVDVLIRKAIEG